MEMKPEQHKLDNGNALVIATLGALAKGLPRLHHVGEAGWICVGNIETAKNGGEPLCVPDIGVYDGKILTAAINTN